MDISRFSSESLNPLLEERLALLKRERETDYGDHLRVEQTVSFLNEILYGVIHHHASDFNAVRVGFNFDPSRERRDLTVHNVFDLAQYVSKIREEFDSPTTFLFLHLPYKDSRNVPANESKTVRTLDFQAGYSRDHAPATLVVDLRGGYGGLFSNEVGISLEEIQLVELIKLNDNSQFSPEFNGTSFNPANSALGHYLKFRNFIPSSIEEIRETDQISDKDMRERVKGLVGRISVPSEDFLLKTSGDHTLIGYFAVQESDGIVLYRLVGGITPGLSKIMGERSSAKYMYAADIISRHKAGEDIHPAIYKGHEAVQQLHREFAKK